MTPIFSNIFILIVCQLLTWHMIDSTRHNVIHDTKEIHDKKHIKDHLGDLAQIKEEDMTPEQMDFYYFELHDTNRDNQLDGLEMFKAFLEHIPIDYEGKTMEDKGTSPQDLQINLKNHIAKQFSEIEEMVALTLDEDDLNKDGYISYSEFKKARTSS